MVVSLYRDGFTLPDIAKKVSVTERTVSSIIARMGVTSRVKPWSIGEVVDMAHLINDGTGRHAVAYFMHRSLTAVNNQWHKINKLGKLEYYLSKKSQCSRDEVERKFNEHKLNK